MEPTLSVITLATDDLPRAVHFYQEGLGLPTNGIVGSAEDDTQVAFFSMSNGLKLALWPRQSLAKQLGFTPTGTGQMLSHNVAELEQVEQLVQVAAASGADILRGPHWQPWGCFGAYFKDPDGHCWEITYNPTYQSSGKKHIA